MPHNWNRFIQHHLGFFDTGILFLDIIGIISAIMISRRVENRPILKWGIVSVIILTVSMFLLPL